MPAMQTNSKTVAAVNDATAVFPVRPGESLDWAVVGAMSATVQLQSSDNNFLGYVVEQNLTAAASGRIEGSPGRNYRFICTAYVSGSPVMSLTQVADRLVEYQSKDGYIPFGVNEQGPYFGKMSQGLQAAQLISKDVTITAALLDAGGKVTVIPANAGSADQYKIRGITLVGGGTNYAAGGDRLISLSDGTTTYTTIANADIESVPAASLPWGNAKVPMLTNTSDVATAAGAEVKFAYSGGTTDHSATGSIKFNVLLEKVA